MHRPYPLHINLPLQVILLYLLEHCLTKKRDQFNFLRPITLLVHTPQLREYIRRYLLNLLRRHLLLRVIVLLLHLLILGVARRLLVLDEHLHLLQYLILHQFSLLILVFHVSYWFILYDVFN